MGKVAHLQQIVGPEKPEILHAYDLRRNVQTRWRAPPLQRREATWRGETPRGGGKRLLVKYGRHKRGTRARIARELGVSEATVSRDAAHPAMLCYLFLYGGRMKDYRAFMLLAG